MGGNGRGVMYYTGAFWVVAIIVVLIILFFAWGCTDWNGKSCPQHFKLEKNENWKDDDDRIDKKSFNQEYDD